MQLHAPPSLPSPLKRPPPPLIPPPATHRRVSTPLHRRPLLTATPPHAGNGGTAAVRVRSYAHHRALHVLQPPAAAACAPGSTSTRPGTNLGFRSPGPELGLLSLVFVISMVTMSFFAMAVVSLPATGALMKLWTAMDKLSKVASKEVPGTLMSLKLSAREINELTQQLSSLRGVISRIRGHGKEDRIKKRRSKRGGDDPLIV